MRRWILLVGAWALAFSVHAETLVIPGSGACEVVLQRLAEGFQRQYPQDQVQIPPSIGSSGGVKAVMNDEAIVARVARPLREAEASAGLKQRVFARDAVAFAVGASATVRTLSSNQLADIYAGRIDNWSAVGGANAPIRVLVREATDTSTVILQHAFPALRDIRILEQAKLVNHDYEMIELLDKYKTALGWCPQSLLASAHTEVKALAIDGASPSLADMTSGKYPALIDFSLVFKEERLNDSARRFIAYIFSPAGQQILRDSSVLAVAAL